MSNFPPTSVVSGIAYPIVSVAGRACNELADFVGETEFAIDNDGPYIAHGCGSVHGETVRFFEKKDGGVGLDVRVWRIGAAATGGFIAEHGL